MNAIKAQPAQDLLGAPFAGNVVISSQAVKAMNLPNGKADKPLASFAQALEGAIVAKENEPADKVDMGMMLLASFQAVNIAQVPQVVGTEMVETLPQPLVEAKGAVLSGAEGEILKAAGDVLPEKQPVASVSQFDAGQLTERASMNQESVQNEMPIPPDFAGKENALKAELISGNVPTVGVAKPTQDGDYSSIVATTFLSQKDDSVSILKDKLNQSGQKVDQGEQGLNPIANKAASTEQNQKDQGKQTTDSFISTQPKLTGKEEKTVAAVQNIKEALNEKISEKQPGKVVTPENSVLLQTLAEKVNSPIVELRTETVESPVQPILSPLHTNTQSATIHAALESVHQSGPAADKHEVVKQIVEQARLINTRQNSEMVIQLKPDHLGDMAVKVSVEQSGVVNASFHSNNPEVRAVIEASLLQLKQELSSQGLKVDNVGVYAGLGQFLSDQGQRGQQSHEFQKSTKRSQEVFEETVEAVQAVQANGSDDGVDYRV